MLKTPDEVVGIGALAQKQSHHHTIGIPAEISAGDDLRVAADVGAHLRVSGGKFHHALVCRDADCGADCHRSRYLKEFLDQPVHTVITVCGNADQACPIFPGQVDRHLWPFDDPARATGSEEEILACFAKRWKTY